jgi:hypothetical protein
MVLEIKNITQELIDNLKAATVADNDVCRGKDIDIDWSCMKKEEKVQMAHIFENLGSILQELKDSLPDGSDF